MKSTRKNTIRKNFKRRWSHVPKPKIYDDGFMQWGIFEGHSRSNSNECATTAVTESARSFADFMDDLTEPTKGLFNLFRQHI